MLGAREVTQVEASAPEPGRSRTARIKKNLDLGREGDQSWVLLLSGEGTGY